MLKFNKKTDSCLPFLKDLKLKTDQLDKYDRKKLMDQSQIEIIKKNYCNRIFVKGLNTAELLLPFHHHGPNPKTGEYLNNTGKLKNSIRFTWTGRSIQIKIDDEANKVESLEARGGSIFDFTQNEKDSISYNLDQKLDQLLKDTYPEFDFPSPIYTTYWPVVQHGRQTMLTNWRRIL
jgi:hypothetical protein